MQRIKRRGDFSLTMNELIRILIALLCLGFLALLIINLYGLFSSRSKLEQAKANLDEIEGSLKAISDNQKEYLLLSPQDWVIASFGDGNGQSGCNGKQCICFCEEKDCSSNAYICKSMEKQVLFRDQVGTNILVINEEMPVTLLLYKEKIGEEGSAERWVIQVNRKS